VVEDLDFLIVLSIQVDKPVDIYQQIMIENKALFMQAD
jgi:hypothetical protein